MNRLYNKILNEVYLIQDFDSWDGTEQTFKEDIQSSLNNHEEILKFFDNELKVGVYSTGSYTSYSLTKVIGNDKVSEFQNESSKKLMKLYPWAYIYCADIKKIKWDPVSILKFVIGKHLSALQNMNFSSDSNTASAELKSFTQKLLDEINSLEFFLAPDKPAWFLSSAYLDENGYCKRISLENKWARLLIDIRYKDYIYNCTTTWLKWVK